MAGFHQLLQVNMSRLMTDSCLRTTGLHLAAQLWELKQVNSTALAGAKPVGRFLIKKQPNGMIEDRNQK